MQMTKGLYGKYKIEKADGTPINPQAQYFILRLDTDPYARRAVRTYIKYMHTVNPQLASDLKHWLNESCETDAGKKEIDLFAAEVEEQHKHDPKGSFFNP